MDGWRADNDDWSDFFLWRIGQFALLILERVVLVLAILVMFIFMIVVAAWDYLQGRFDVVSRNTPL